MTSNCIDVFNATTFKDFSSFSKRFTSIKDVINQDCCFTFNLTDDAPIAIIDYAQDDSEREEGYIIGEVEGKTTTTSLPVNPFLL